jgi:hypothetical protein
MNPVPSARAIRERRREFKTYAAAHDLKLNELLVKCFETYRKQQGGRFRRTGGMIPVGLGTLRSQIF